MSLFTNFLYHVPQLCINDCFMGIFKPCVDKKDTSKKRRNKIIQCERKDRFAMSKARKSWIFQNGLSFQKFYAPEMQKPPFADGVNSLSTTPGATGKVRLLWGICISRHCYICFVCLWLFGSNGNSFRYELGQTNRRYSLKDLKYFLEDYNGIKLYRDVFRIGFLGNKESNWIKLQQFRTKGQQWYRFDLGNTVGYVSLSDVGQRHIQEISSRLDISANETSEAFKLLINVVFNYLFYTLNRKANDLIKTILAEEGLLEENLSKRVKKNDAALREMIQRNKRMQKALADVSEHLQRGTQISGTDQVALPQQSYAFLTDTFKKLDADIKADSSVQESTAVLLSEADAQLKAIEVESYNNYKLLQTYTRLCFLSVQIVSGVSWKAAIPDN